MIAITTKSSIKVKPDRDEDPDAPDFVIGTDRALIPTAAVDCTRETPRWFFKRYCLQILSLSGVNSLRN